MPRTIRLVLSYFLTASCLIGVTTTFAATPNPPISGPSAIPKKLSQTYGKLPLSFEANQGQTDPSVQFLSRGNGYSLHLTNSAAVLALSNGKSGHAAVVRMELTGANPQAKASGTGQLPGVSNYFLGNVPAKWHTDIPTYAKVQYTAVYPGIDLVYYGNQSQLEYDFVIAPGADPDRIRLHFAGARSLTVTASGDLSLRARGGQLNFRSPSIYQQSGDRRIEIPGHFTLQAHDVVSFQLGKYDHSQPLIIDPILSYSTYLGGTYTDQGNGIAVDSQGNAYIAGTTTSSDFPTKGPYQTSNQGNGDAFITKLNPTGTALVYSTFLGGSDEDQGLSIAIDSADNAYVAGYTRSVNFPVTAGAFQTSSPAAAQPGNKAAFVAKLSASGASLLYSTYLGGSAGGLSVYNAGTIAKAIAVDHTDSAYVVGYTTNSNFPVTTGAFQTANAAAAGNCANAFVTKLNPQGTALTYSTYLGGPISNCEYYVGGSAAFIGDTANAIVVDSGGNAYVAGNAWSASFPVTSQAYQQQNGNPEISGGNPFVTKLNPSGTALVYSTYVGGSNGQDGCGGVGASGIAIDSLGNAYITGGSQSENFPVTSGVFLSTAPPGPSSLCPAFGFVSKLNPQGSDLLLSTFLGSYQTVTAGPILDSAGNMYISGSLKYFSFPTSQGALSTASDGYVAKLNPTLSAIEYATMMGGPAPPAGSYGDMVDAIAGDASGNIYITGHAGSAEYPTTTGAFQTTNKGLNAYGAQGDAFVSKLALAGETGQYFPSTIAITNSTPTSGQAGQKVTMTAKVTGPTSSPAPTGEVAFNVSACSSPGQCLPDLSFTTNAALNASGTATGTTPPLNDGLYTISASYLGDANHLTSTTVTGFSPISIDILGPATQIASGGGYGTYGGGVLLFAVATDTAGQGVPGVKVNFTASKGIRSLSSFAFTNQIGQAAVSGIGTDVGTFQGSASIASVAQPISIPFTVNPAPLYVNVEGGYRRYGQPNPAFSSIFTGLVGTDTVPLSYSTTAVATSPVGAYPVTATAGGPDAYKYTVSINSGTLQVTPALLAITARSVASTYGQTPPKPTAYFLTGFVNGDTASVVSGAPALSTSVTATTPVGTYPITVGVGTLSAANYQFSTIANGEGVAQVAKAPLIIRPASVSIHAGDPLPTFTYSITGFVNGDTQATAITGTPALTTTAPNNTTPGRYYIIANTGTLSAHNYSFSQPSAATNGILTILPN